MDAHVTPVTRVSYAEPTRDELVKGLWPDKALYAAVILFVTGFVGILTGLVQLTVGLDYGASVPAVFAAWPFWVTLGLSVLTTLAAYLALRERSTSWAVRGCVLALFSLGFLGVNALLAVIAAVFVLRSWREGETANPATRVLTPDMWPDKALAGALLMLIASVVTLYWGVAILFDGVTFPGYFASRAVFGTIASLVGLGGLLVSSRLFQQRTPRIGMLFAVLLMAVGALWVIGPVLAFASFVLVVFGLREHEFEEQPVSA